MARLELSRGQRIKVSVEELQPGRHMVVSYQGHLLRVQNTSERSFQKGDTVLLLVLQTNPIELSLSPEKTFVRLA
jgi:hypothetical protein